MTTWFFICANWSMVCRSTVEGWDTTLALAINGYCVVFDLMLISILSTSVVPLEILCAEAAVALAPWAGDLKAKDLLSPLHLMCVFRNLIYLSPVRLSVISLGAWLDLDCVGFR